MSAMEHDPQSAPPLVFEHNVLSEVCTVILGCPLSKSWPVANTVWADGEAVLRIKLSDRPTISAICFCSKLCFSNNNLKIRHAGPPNRSRTTASNCLYGTEKITSIRVNAIDTEASHLFHANHIKDPRKVDAVPFLCVACAVHQVCRQEFPRVVLKSGQTFMQRNFHVWWILLRRIGYQSFQNVGLRQRLSFLLKSMGA